MQSLAEIMAQMRAEAVQSAVAAEEPQSGAERQRSYKRRQRAKKKRNIAILDMETDPFDNVARTEILPFCACLYSREFETIVIWEEDYEIFVNRLMAAILGLPDAFTIYAHNGGKFDFMFLIHKLRGEVAFKGRGIMRASIGPHELRDSYHIIPERLANLKKEKFDYEAMKKKNRAKLKAEIIAYLISDCENLLYFVEKFIDKFGFKISVGAAAMAKLNESYKVEKVTPFTDERLRKFFYGGRVQCIQGAGYFVGPLKLYDVNSMYPFVMATKRHPIGSEYFHRSGKPNAQTFFLKLHCENNGAFVARDEEGNLTTDIRQGEFFTTIYEYEMALELDLISNVEVLECVDCFSSTTFEKFVTPLYELRAAEKDHLNSLSVGSAEWETCNSEMLFLKLLLNNAYGKFAQNPRRYKEHYLSDPGVRPEDEQNPYELEFQGENYWIWSRPAPEMRFNNVGTAASITGAARSVLMRAIHSAKNPIYCDTDSLICEELRDHELHKSKLGAWDLEKEISELIICGKKLYAYKDLSGKETKIKSKGTGDLSWDDMLAMLGGEITLKYNKAPTLTRTRQQRYIQRRIGRTAPLNLARLPHMQGKIAI